ncbi:endogenous retrovirus group K member 113 Gag polyprotein-like [Cricetulus griseus]|uniref:Endogenous retrovirus group K member 113 Gag polyprotein-like n=1 Tax=Cricetulus griseus TaxID=10029 RepID=A0A9J7F183_CRIGR|nr:endogenous retrovirus group K member 113 Gag polyprotein-like [Cricetulus griseus]XP_027292783.1 endogenous retrovirus group K member 113 Gag polyprotein-like [Cricetulus griseus]
MGNLTSQPIYLALQELLHSKGLKLEKGQEVLEQLKEECSMISEKDSSEESSSESEEELELLVKKMERSSLWTRSESCEVEPTAPGLPPPPYNVTSSPSSSGGGGQSFCPEVWKEVRHELCYPVFQNNEEQRYHEPLDFKTIKALAESVRTYGVTSAFTTAQVEALNHHCMTPSNWMSLVRTSLSPGQYLDWKAFLIEYANEQAAVNRAVENAAWDVDMLLRPGRFAQQQIGYLLQVFQQINNITTRAWKSLPNKGEVSGNLTKIIQGPMEPFSDFVARMVEAAGRIFGDPDLAMPLIKHLVFEQCTKECKAAITPYKNKGLEAWMKVCRKLGGPLTNAGLTAEDTKLKQARKGSKGTCFCCGKMGHLKRQCPESRSRHEPGTGNHPKQPGLCPECKKGNHWANECRSVKDIHGQPLTQQYGGAHLKNGQRVP